MAMLLLKASGMEKHSVIRFSMDRMTRCKCQSFWDASSVQWRVLRDQRYTFRVRSLLIVKKVCWWGMTWSLIVSSMQRS